MSFDWHHYCELAKDLNESLPQRPLPYSDVDLASIRCSISRAYYTAYWFSRRYLEGRFVDFRIAKGEGDSHIKVVNRMRKEGGELGLIGDQLNALRLKRMKADYERKVHFNGWDAESGVTVAEQVMDRLEKLAAN